MRHTSISSLAWCVLAVAACVAPPSPAAAQTLAAETSVECDPVGVGNYRSGIVKETAPGGGYLVDLDDYTPNGRFVTCPANKLRVVPREAFTKGPPGAFGVFHSGDRVECGAAGAPGKIVALADPKGVYLVLSDGSDPAAKPVTCDGAGIKRFTGLPTGQRGFKR